MRWSLHHTKPSQQKTSQMDIWCFSRLGILQGAIVWSALPQGYFIYWSCSLGTTAALGHKKVIVLKVKVQKEVKYTRSTDLELRWLWFTSEKIPREGAMPSKPSDWSKKISSLQKSSMHLNSFPCKQWIKAFAALLHNRVARLMTQAKWKQHWVECHGRSHPLAS